MPKKPLFVDLFSGEETTPFEDSTFVFTSEDLAPHGNENDGNDNPPRRERILLDFGILYIHINFL